MQIFPAKILLFGEYSIFYRSEALAIPFSECSGKLIFDKRQNPSNDQLRNLVKQIESVPIAGFNNKFDCLQFKNDVLEGLTFDSNIPQNYGLGSSGALSAALYKRYSRYSETIIAGIKNDLALIESLFHGSSSGTDPLVSYLNVPVLVRESVPVVVNNLNFNKSDFQFFLVDSEIPRNTRYFVGKFHESCKNSAYLYQVQNKLIPLVNSCIDLLQANSMEELYTGKFGELSQLQFELFSEMIPAQLKTVWKSGLDTGRYFLKLCGAGGGGFFLGCCRKEDVDFLPGKIILIN